MSRIKKTIFYTIFLLAFCFSFLLSILSQFTYRLALVSLLAIPLLFFYRVKFDRVFVAYVILVIIVLISGIYNNSSLINILLFLRILFFSYLIYYLAKVSLTPKLIISVIKACVWIAIIQLPIILLQWKLYASLPLRWRGDAVLQDFGSGTFNYKTDYAMSFFLVLVVIFLLFEKKRNYFIKNKFIIAVWLSITVLIANSQIMKIPLLLVWLAFLVTNISFRNVILIGFGALVVSASLIYFSKNNLTTEGISTFLYRLSSSSNIDTYLSGSYSRVAALKYFASDGFTWLGAGPSAFSDPIKRTLLRGNTGHSFTFFSEIGFIGWVASLVVLFVISFPVRNGKVQISWTRVLIFTSEIVLSFTSQVMNDIAVFFIFCIMLDLYLISPKQVAVDPHFSR
jgi:hypothetical protein